MNQTWNSKVYNYESDMDSEMYNYESDMEL